MEKAIEEYRGLQFDVNRESIITYKSKILALQQIIGLEHSERKVKELIQTIRLLQQEIGSLEQTLAQTQEEAQLVGGGALTQLEVWKENQKTFKKEAEKRKANLKRMADQEAANKTDIVDLTEE